MKTVTIDFSGISLRYELHLLLKTAFSFPDYYGMNLDALYDCLGDIREDTAIELKNTEALKESLGRYGEITEKVFRDAASENPHLILS